MRALAIAATGMNAQELNVEVIANNIANINTTGFKRGRAEFTDLLYQAERTAGAAARGSDTVVPEGINVGLGVRAAAVRNVHTQGALAQTDNKLDLATIGSGWFKIDSPDGETLYTRSGAFNTDSAGRIVTIDGYLVQPAISVPDQTVKLTINQDGKVFALVDGETAPQEIGQLTLATFANEAGLTPLGNNLFRETEASGAATTGVPGEPGFGTIRQGYLEDSNVDPVKEITELISAQRAYEMNSKVIQAADDMLSTTSKGLR
ncbi:MAG: flagellar basal-body rod protein FlgG [Alphaproteobacteria bacterium BRH_c36]|nr:MAG: flagellar basal-body rod protein FlgG [Alphaproteobacteria bacterium BRH_c36]